MQSGRLLFSKSSSAPVGRWAKNTCDLGVTVSVKPMSISSWRSWAKVILGFDIVGSLSTKSLVQVVLGPGNGLDRPLVKPVAHGDMDTDCLAAGKQVGWLAACDVVLDVNPVGFLAGSIIHDQDDGLRSSMRKRFAH